MRRFILMFVFVIVFLLASSSLGQASSRGVSAWERSHPIHHWKLWQCIHLGKRAGASYGWGEGNSSTGSHTGPLQMTYPWAGHYVRWYYVPLRRVYRIAELEYRKRGYSQVWLEGQWNGTSQPCLQYAR